MHANSRLLFERFALDAFRPGLRVLEVGPDGFPSTFQQIVGNLPWDTIDISSSPELTYAATNPYEFPIPSDTYDIVFSAQVIEHVARIWRFMPELARVTKPGGYVITINPVSWPYHEAPIDCWRMYPEAMKALCDDSGLTVETCFSGSLESPHTKRAIPGRSRSFQARPLRLAYSVLGVFGFPVEKSFDTITIARKR